MSQPRGRLLAPDIIHIHQPPASASFGATGEKPAARLTLLVRADQVIE